MTTFTRIFLNPRKRGARNLLTNPQAMHAAVRSSFPPDIETSESRVLWRVDHSGDVHTLYIVGPEKPDAGHIVEQAGWDTRPPETANYDRLLDSITRGQKWRFELTANPVSSKAGERGTRGKLVAHVTAEQQTQWLRNKGEAHGFTLLEDATVIHRDSLGFNQVKGDTRNRITLASARFSGTLEVADAESRRSTLALGLGRGRAYGCGLMTLAPVSLASS